MLWQPRRCLGVQAELGEISECRKSAEGCRNTRGGFASAGAELPPGSVSGKREPFRNYYAQGPLDQQFVKRERPPRTMRVDPGHDPLVRMRLECERTRPTLQTSEPRDIMRATRIQA